MFTYIEIHFYVRLDGVGTTAVSVHNMCEAPYLVCGVNSCCGDAVCLVERPFDRAIIPCKPTTALKD